MGELAVQLRTSGVRKEIGVAGSNGAVFLRCERGFLKLPKGE